MTGLQGQTPESESASRLESDDRKATSEPSSAKGDPGRIKRFLLTLLGMVFVVLAGIGVILPGLPATGPLILASICLTKSSPRLERRLVRSRFFAPFHQYLDGNAEMPMKARLVAMALMWLCIIVSSVLMLRSENVATWIVVLVILSGFAGTFFIARYRKSNGATDAP